VADELESGMLVRLLTAFEPTAEPVHPVFAGGGLMRPGVRAFVTFATTFLGRLPIVRG
jgi:hypothetical protein